MVTMIRQVLANALLFLCAVSFGLAADQPPRIIHEPVKAAVTGQPVYIRATVRDDGGAAKAVNLYCSVSSDSAPFKVPMRASGAGAFIASIPRNLIQNSGQVSYYIEAFDSLEQSTETPWYTITFRTASGKTAGSADGKKKSSWKKPLLITAGTAAAIGIGVAVAGGGSGDGDDGGGTTPPGDTGGLFSGSATRFLQLSGGALTSETYSVVLNLLDSGTITSDDLHPGANMSAPVTANAFTMVGTVSDGNLSGSVTYRGTVADTTINGSISGSVVTSTGTNGTYSGVFSATKQ